MAVSCKYCGKALRDGELCSCPQAQAEAAGMYQGYQPPPQGYQPPPQGYQQPPQGYQPPPQGYQPPPQGYQPPPQGYQPPPRPPAGPNPVGAAFRRLLPYAASYFKAPVSAAQGLMARRDAALAALLLGIQVVAGALLLCAFVSAYLNYILIFVLVPMVLSISPLFGDSLDSFAELDIDLSALLELIDVKFSVNVPISLLFSLLAAAVVTVVFVLIAFAAGRLSGSRCSLRDAAAACAAHSLFVTALSLLSFLFSLFFMPLGVIFLALALLAWLMLAVPTLTVLAPDAPQGRLWSCAIAGVLATLLLGGFTVHFFGTAAVGKATVEINKDSLTVEEMREDIEEMAEAAAEKLEELLENPAGSIEALSETIHDVIDMLEQVNRYLNMLNALFRP